MTLKQGRARPDGHRPIEYPESDGKPMAETDLHRDEMNRLITTLQAAFAARPDVYVSGNLLLYYEEGNPRRCVSPDVFVVIGVLKHRRDTYLLWEEGAPPGFVVEVTSRTTRREDMQTKRSLYARLGVQEYILYDPRSPTLAYLDPPLQANRLVEGEYRPITADEDGAFVSETLGMRLRLVEGRLQLRDARTNALLLSPAEHAELLERRVAELEEQLRQRDAGR
jgi:Uma2 family endonuclease